MRVGIMLFVVGSVCKVIREMAKESWYAGEGLLTISVGKIQVFQGAMDRDNIYAWEGSFGGAKD